MSADGLNALVYDGKSRMVTNTQAGVTTSYAYDGNGLRVRKQVAGGATTVYIFSGTKVLAEYENGAAPASPTREYIYTSASLSAGSGAQLLATLEGGSTKYHHADHLSVRLNTDAAGNVSRTFAHYPYGEVWYETGTASKWKFTSYERDAESGNDYAIARYHINRLGRFNAPDPLAGNTSNPQRLNRYAYVRNDPINRIDPSGLTDGELCGGQECLMDDVPGLGWDWDWMQAAYDVWRGITLTEILFGRFGDLGFPGRSPGGPGGDLPQKAELRELFQNSDCAVLLGGTAKANRILSKWSGYKNVSSPNWHPASPLERYVTSWIVSGQRVSAVIVPTRTTNERWSGAPFNVYVGETFSGYGRSQQLAVTIHEFMHVAWQGTAFNQVIDIPVPTFGAASVSWILSRCGLGWPSQ